MTKKRPGVEFLLKVATTIQKELEGLGTKPKDSREIALKTVEVIRKDHGGTEIYVPKGMALTLISRDWQIWEEFDGTNYPALARKHQLTERRVRTIIARCREEENLKPGRES